MNPRQNKKLGTRRNFVKAAAVMGAGWSLAPAWCSAMASGPDARTTEVLASVIGVDMHNHVYPTGIPESRPASFSGGDQTAQTDPSPPVSLAGQLREAGLTAVCASYELDFTPIAKPGDARDNYLRWIDALDRQLARETMRRAYHLRDLQAAHAAGQPTIVQSVEGAQFIEGQLQRIEEVYRRGLRHLQLLHDRDDLVAPLGGTDAGMAGATGLTETGRDVIRECNRLGIVVDLAHAGPQTILDARKVTRQPFLVSHTGPALGQAPTTRIEQMIQPRLLDRERASAIAEAGAVIGVWIYMAESPESYVRNVRAMVDLAGVDHVGIGTDTNILSTRAGKSTNLAWPGLRAGFLRAVVAEMLTQGFSVDEIRKICGGNFCRVFDRVTRSHP